MLAQQQENKCAVNTLRGKKQKSQSSEEEAFQMAQQNLG